MNTHFALATSMVLALVAASDTASHAALPIPVVTRAAAAPAVVLPAWAADLPGDDTITDAARDEIQHEARGFAERANEAQRRELFMHLSQGAKCGRAHAAALVGALSVGVEPALVTQTLASMTTSCNEVIVESVGFVPNPDPAIATALLASAQNTHEDAVRRSAWLSYGAIGETARRMGKQELARSIDGTLADALDTSTGADRVLFVRAAGNAGCIACKERLDGFAQSKDDELRRAAIVAHRFIESKESVALMCQALESDRDGVARDMAAWSLEWRTNDGALRAGCLERAALKDRSKGVRLQAVRALGILSDDVPAAYEALGRLAIRPGDVGALAGRTLDIREVADDGEEPSGTRTLAQQ
jgi:hypothetical protein